jgi:glycosyltransferase involved in cell wall biosynthesis
MSKADRDQGAAWEQALDYYRSRGGVLFISYCRFWERHGFVQQSLAQRLARHGVEVAWFDGSDWRPYRPVVVEPNQKLLVSQLPAVPLRRFGVFDRLDARAKSAFLKRYIKKMGGNPVIWVQAGVDEAVAAELPYIDVFSVFDDPYRHGPTSNLVRKAKVIVCQNQTARDVLLPVNAGKVHVLRPPIDMMDSSLGGSADVFLPAGFPNQVMGYVGSFFYDGFDFELFEQFIHSFPDWGFILMGRTDAPGLEALARWKKFKNFHYFPWVPRNQVASVWKKIKLTLLFYRPNRTQDGAFPVKILEAMRFGVPAIASSVPKTADLEGYFPRSSDLEQMKKNVETALMLSPEAIRDTYEHFSNEMDPKSHLAKVSQWLRPTI